MKTLDLRNEARLQFFLLPEDIQTGQLFKTVGA